MFTTAEFLASRCGHRLGCGAWFADECHRRAVGRLGRDLGGGVVADPCESPRCGCVTWLVRSRPRSAMTLPSIVVLALAVWLLPAETPGVIIVVVAAVAWLGAVALSSWRSAELRALLVDADD